jgi:hypothetical protein
MVPDKQNELVFQLEGAQNHARLVVKWMHRLAFQCPPEDLHRLLQWTVVIPQAPERRRFHTWRCNVFWKPLHQGRAAPGKTAEGRRMCGLQRASKGFDGTEPRNSPASPTMPRQLGPKGRSDLRTSLPHPGSMPRGSPCLQSPH